MSILEGRLSDIYKSSQWVLKLLVQFSPGLMLAVFLTQLITASMPFLRAKVFSQLLDALTIQDSGSWQSPFIIFMVIALLTSLFLFLQGQLSSILDIKLQAHLRKIFITKVAGLDYQQLESKEISSLITKVDNEFGWRIRTTADSLNNLFFNIASFVAITVIILPTYPYIWLLIMVTQIPQYLIERYWVKKDWQNYDANSDKNKEIWDLNYQLRQKNYIAELRINNAVDYLLAKFNNLFDYISNQRVSVHISKTPSEVIMSIFTILISGISLFIIINDVRLGIITIGAFTFYFDTIRRVSEVFQGIVYNTVSITENSYHIENFRRVLELKNISRESTHKIKPNSTPPLIEIKEVSFRYPGSNRYIIKNLNLVINPGEEIALVGSNGAGKSTLIKLICGFYYPTSGEVLIGGVNTKDLDLSSWYKHLSYLTQEFNNFGNMTLADNVKIGNPTKHSSKSKILDSLESADAHFWKKYSKGIDTPLSQRYGGEEPSWGQWQKISIARIFYRNSTVMIMDEPTASIDAVSEYRIFNKIYNTVKGKTLIIVSHRFSTVRNAGRILVLNKGKIVEAGSHSELIKHGGIYAKSFALQAEGYN